MEFDVFKADVEPGGLYNIDEIKILICYILNNIQDSLPIENISNIIRADELANYFDIIQAVSSLSDEGNIIIEDNNYSLTQKGKMIADELTNQLPFTVREKAIIAAKKESLILKRLKDNKVTINSDKNGYLVRISMLENDAEFMGISIRVTDIQQANIIKENFLKDPTIVYLENLKLLLGYEHSDNLT